MNKTNVMRYLAQRKISYTQFEYPHRGLALDGISVAQLIGRDVDEVYKTLVTAGNSGRYYVFVIPANKELDLKKAAKCVVEKSISMVPKEEILTLTGYVKGGCSPVGMKKRYYTTFDISVKVRESIIISAGKIGYQVELDPQKLIQLLRAGIADVIVES